MGNKTILIVCFLMCATTGIICYRLTKMDDRRIGVVDAVRLFDEFNMKKELEKKEKVKLEAMGKQMDSVGNLLNMAKATKNEEEIKRLSYAGAYMKNAIENEYTESNRDINTKVWKRLNPVMDAYGKKKGLHLVIGANGMGSVLYNDEYYDMTNDAIQFANKRYEEGN